MTDASTAGAVEARPIEEEPALVPVRECRMCGHCGPEDDMFNAGYGWYCGDPAECDRRQRAKILAADSAQTPAPEPKPAAVVVEETVPAEVTG